MPTSYSTLLGLALPVTGELSGTWGDEVNNYITQYLDSAVAGVQTISGSQTAVTLSRTTNAALSQAGSGFTGSSQYQIINCTGNPASALTVTVPSTSKVYVVLNNTSTSQTVTVKPSAAAGVTVAAARAALIAWNGTDFELVATDDASKMNGVLAAVNGGTGQSSYAVGDILYASTTTALSKLADVATGNALISGGVGVAPSYGKIGLTTHVSGTLPIGNGGTGVTGTPSNGQLLIGNGTGYTVANLTQGTGVTITNSSGGITIAATGTGGTVTSVSGTGTVNGLTLSGTVTSSGSLTLGGAISGVPNSATTATSANTASAIVARDASGNFSAGTITATLSGTATQVSNSLTLATSGTGLSGSATFNGSSAQTFTVTSNATSANTASTIVARDASGNFSAGTITGTLSGNATNVSGVVAVANGGTGATDAATARSNLGAGTVTSVSGTGTVQGLTLSGSVTSSGSLTLGGSLSAVSLTSQVSGTLPVGNGGTGATTLTGVLKGNGTSAFTAATAGTDFVAPGTATSFTATQTFSGTSSALAMVLTDAAEVATISATAATGTINYDVTTQSVLFYTSNASANWTVNLRGSSGTSMNTLMSTGQSVTVAFLVTNGATAYYNTSVQVDGTTSGVTTRWQGGTAPTSGNASSVDIYSYTIIKTANATFSVFASQTRFA